MNNVPRDAYLLSTKPPATISKLLTAAKAEPILLSTSVFCAGSSAKLYGESLRKALTGLLLDTSAARSFYTTDVGLKLYLHPTYSAYVATTTAPQSRCDWEKSVLTHASKPQVSSVADVCASMATSDAMCEVGAVVSWKQLRGVFYTFDATEEPDEMALVQEKGRELASRFRLPCFRLERTSYSGPWTMQVESTPSRACSVQ